MRAVGEFLTKQYQSPVGSDQLVELTESAAHVGQSLGRLGVGELELLGRGSRRSNAQGTRRPEGR